MKLPRVDEESTPAMSSNNKKPCRWMTSRDPQIWSCKFIIYVSSQPHVTLGLEDVRHAIPCAGKRRGVEKRSGGGGRTVTLGIDRINN